MCLIIDALMLMVLTKHISVNEILIQFRLLNVNHGTLAMKENIK